jgi:ATP synthase protein I
MTAMEPERMVLRRVLPFVVPALALALATGWLLGGPGVGASAAIGIVIVAANLAASAATMSWAARISPVMLYAAALGGFFIRLVVLVVVLLLLDPLAWFSAVAFALAVVPATIALLVFEAMALSTRKMQSDLWYFRETT